MPKSLVAGRVPESWAAELKQIGNDTGKNQSESGGVFEYWVNLINQFFFL